jgi:hypothetical protein
MLQILFQIFLVVINLKLQIITIKKYCTICFQNKYPKKCNLIKMYYVVAVIKTDRQILQSWWNKHQTLSDTEFSEYARSQKSDPFLDVMFTTYKLHPGEIKCYTFRSWQSLHEVHACLVGLLKLLGKFDNISFLAQTEIEQIINGHDPGKWSSSRHFGSDKNT